MGRSRTVFAKCIGLCLGVLLDGEFAAVVTAFGAYVVIHYWSSAIAASGELCFLQGVVCSALRCASLRESVFWMWHITIIFVYFSINCFSASHLGSVSPSRFPLSSSSVSGSFPS